ncbi:hypothetical protein BJV77DRAFT_349759 [Russula vinacea]|nr:hypothetical protein BJV77DRAFT_349759 [Russula vinacea]
MGNGCCVSRPICCTVPLCMGPYRTQLFICHNQDQRPRPYPHDRFRPGPASNHGIIWLSVAFLSEAPEAVVAMFSSNDQFIDMLLSPGMIIMIIVATQMHRSLVDFAFGSPNGAGDALELGNASYSRSKLPRASITLPKRASRNLVEVTVHKAFEQPTTQTNDDGSCETANVQMDEKPTEWNLGDDTVRTV